MIKTRLRDIISASMMVLLTVSNGGAAIAATSSTASTSISTNASHSADETAIRAQAAAYSKAYEQGNAAALANMWTEDGTFTDVAGHEYKGRAAIQNRLERIFKTRGNAALEITVQSLKFPTPNTSIEEGIARVAQADAPAETTRYLAFHVRQNGQWRMEAVAETPFTPATAYDSLKPLEWIIGNWSVREPASTGLHINAAWGPNRNFIRTDFKEDNHSGGTNLKQTEIIGWDPISHEIVSWHFDASGGFGYGRWAQEGKDWVVRASSVQPDGSQGKSLYTINPIDSNMYTWQSTHRLHGSTMLPDTGKITVARDNVQTEK